MHGWYLCVHFPIMFSKGLLEEGSGGLLLWQRVKKRIALDEISRNPSEDLFSFDSCSNGLWHKQKFWKPPKEKFTSLLLFPKSGWSWQPRLEWNLAISLRSSLGEPNCSQLSALPEDWHAHTEAKGGIPSWGAELLRTNLQPPPGRTCMLSLIPSYPRTGLHLEMASITRLELKRGH